ncbi:MAG: SPOR domain-containing protein [Rectinemataceae bacterium]
MNRRTATLVLLILVSAQIYAQTAKTPPSPPRITGEQTLVSARTAVNKAMGGESFAIYLETYALALPLHDAILLCKEFLPKAPSSSKADLAVFSGSLALMAGRYADAALLFSQGSALGSGGEGARGTASRPDLLLKAARCNLAAGNYAEAKKNLDMVPGTAGGTSYLGQRNLSLAWLFLLEGESEKAFILLQPLAAGPDEDGLSREAYFLLWLAASAPDFADFTVDTKGYDARTMESRLEAAYPGSMELAFARKDVLAKPAAWLLSGLYASPVQLNAERNLAQDVVAKAKISEEEKGPATLQVGWFSRKENATALAARLNKLGFLTKTDEQKTGDGELRWAVLVDASTDWSGTQAKLKDAGYESYLLP